MSREWTIIHFSFIDSSPILMMVHPVKNNGKVLDILGKCVSLPSHGDRHLGMGAFFCAFFCTLFAFRVMGKKGVGKFKGIKTIGQSFFSISTNSVSLRTARRG